MTTSAAIKPTETIVVAPTKDVADMKNVNNWHWIEKDCTSWSRDFLERTLREKATFSAANASASITAINELKGDVNISNRKGKVIYYYDLELKLDFKGKISDTDVSGSITIPEVMHDLEEYQFEVTISSDTKEKSAIRPLLKQHLFPKVTESLLALGPALYEHQAKTIQYPSGKDNASTPTASSATTASSANGAASTASKASPAVTVASVPSKGLSVSNIDISSEFVTSVHELFEVLLDIPRVKAWAGSDATMDRKVGGSFSLFGGLVTGTNIGLETDRKIVQKWRLKSWPADHFSTVTLELTQGSDSTKLRLSQTGVPVHEVDITQNNWNNFYFNRIKQTFGFGSFF